LVLAQLFSTRPESAEAVTLGLFHARAGRMGSVSEERKGERGIGPLVFAAIVIVLALPALYVLSVGPMIWLANHDYISKEGNLYSPLQWGRDHCEPFNRAVSWYMGLFS
jgi:hypothetical protein